MNKLFYKRFLSYFMQGLLFTLPITITIYIIYLIVSYLDNLLPTDTPGLGLLIILGGVTIIGFIGSKLVGNLVGKLDAFMSKAPFLKIIYTSVKDLISAFVGEKKSFNSPVRVKLFESGGEMIGFITQKSLKHLDIEAEKVAVYVPYSYAFTGNLVIIDRKNITPIEASPTDVLKFIVSGGVTNLELTSKAFEKELTKEKK